MFALKKTKSCSYNKFVRALLDRNLKNTLARLQQCFPNFFVGRHSKNGKHHTPHNGHMNLFMLIASSITGDSEVCDHLFLEISTFFGQHNKISVLSTITSRRHLLSFG